MGEMSYEDELRQPMNSTYNIWHCTCTPLMTGALSNYIRPTTLRVLFELKKHRLSVKL